MDENEYFNSELGVQIWDLKYRNDNESFDDWLTRVSGGDLEVHQLIKDKKFMFGGRILANRGIEGKNVSMSNCFVAGTKVLTKRGLIDIEKVDIGDYVITHDNTWQRVNNTMCNVHKGDIFKIEVVNGYEPIYCTNAHRFYTEEGWVRADRLVGHNMNSVHFKRPHKIKVPSVDYKIEPFSLSLLDYFNVTKESTIKHSDDGHVRCGTTFKGGNNAMPTRYGTSIINTFEVTDDVQYLFGRWIGDGSTTRRRGKRNHSIFQIVFNANNEVDAFERCVGIVEDTFGITPTTRCNESQHTLILRVENALLGEFVANYFGTNESTKRIPSELIGSKPLLLGILDADGSVVHNGAVSLTMKNEDLLYDIRESLALNGINVKPPAKIIQSMSTESRTYSAHKIHIPTSYKHKIVPYMTKVYGDTRMDLSTHGKMKGWTKYAIIGDDLYSNVESVELFENQNVMVYNISVERTHSYSVNGAVCHNCYYLGIKDDSLESIYETAGKLARIFSAGGGVGIDLSTLAPRGAKINNAAKTTSGAVSFAQLFNTTSELIGTEGRRAALLLSLKSEHPDLLEFIDAKANNDSIMKANLSVQVSDMFMNNVQHRFDHWTSFERHNGSMTHIRCDANYILDRLVKNNYNWAEPGIQYIDRAMNYNLMEFISEFEIEGSNACSEKMLPDNGACLLGSLNLSEFVSDGEFDYGSFCVATRIAIDALNDVLDEGVDKHPLPEQIEVAKKWRDIGLGVMGYADALIKLGITYGSEECIVFTKDLSRTMFNEALKASSIIHPDDSIFDRTQLQHIIDSEIVQMNCDAGLKSWIIDHGLRNCALLSIAPTGSISTMLGISGGIEPHYALSYTRRTESLHGEPKSYEVEIPIVKEFKSKFIRDLDTKEMQEIAETGVLPSYFVTAKDIHWKERLRVQEAWQNSVDASISSTINLPEDTTESTIKRIYIEAWQRGLKGITIYRDNCSRTGVLSETKEPVKVWNDSEIELLNSGAKDDCIDAIDYATSSLDEDHTPNEIQLKILRDAKEFSDSLVTEIHHDYTDVPLNFKRGDWNKLSDDLTYIKRKIYTGCGKLTLFIGYSIENSKIEEIYIKRSGKGGCARSLDALAITMSSMLRLGGNIENIEQAFEGLEPCSSFVRERAKGESLSPGSNCAMAMLKELQQFIWECGDEPTELLCNYDELVEDVKDGFMIDTNGGRHAIDRAITTKEEFMEVHNPIIIDDVLYVRDSTNQCPECKSELQHTGGCVSCSCGYTKCD